MELGNQQESLRLIDLGWLAGIIDGEGCLQLTKKTRKNNNIFYHPSLTITNTNKSIIDKLVQIFSDNNIPYWITEYKATNFWKTRYVLQIAGLKRLLKVLPIIKNLLIGKQIQAELLFEWINYRLEKPQSSYTEFDNQVYEKIKELNKRSPL